MKLSLDTPNPAMDDSQVAQINSNNVKKLQATLNKTAVTKLLSIQNTTSTAFSSASLALLMNMSGIVTSSGGFFIVTFSTSVQSPGGVYSVIQLLIDGKVVDGVSIPVAAITTTGPANLSFYGALGPGRHPIEVKCIAIGGGTFTFNFTAGTYTTLQATEILL